MLRACKRRVLFWNWRPPGLIDKASSGWAPLCVLTGPRPPALPSPNLMAHSGRDLIATPALLVLRHGPNLALAVDHPYTTLAETLTNPFLRGPLCLFVLLAVVGVQTQKTLWASSRKRSVTGKGQGQGKHAQKPASTGAQAAVMI